MRILIVDDSEDFRELTETALFSAGYQDVISADSAWAAIKFLDIGQQKSNGAVPVDIILLDIMMPEVDGIEACARIRKDERYTDVPIIMITSLADMDNLSNAFVAGANDYITKPINRIELLARIRAALRLKAELVHRQEREHELLNFLSSWGDRRSTLWIDDVTGLFVGEVAEAYLAAIPTQQGNEPLSVITVSVDHIDAYRAAQGDSAANAILARVAASIRTVSTTVGVTAASYRNGLFVIIAPGYDATGAATLAEALRIAIARLTTPSSQSISAIRVTATVAIASGYATDDMSRTKLLTQAISSVQASPIRGGNEAIAISA
jgi:phosphoserine phosphatase RsbU/P